MDSSYSNAGILQKAFTDYLKNKNLRYTVEREAILKTVCQTKDPFSLEMIGQQLESKKFPVSRASLYNTMELLLDAKIVVRHQFNGANVQYELKFIAEQYSHTICTECGAVQKIKKNDKWNHVFTDKKIPKFNVEYVELRFYGICSKCKYRIAQIEKQANNKHNNLKNEES